MDCVYQQNIQNGWSSGQYRLQQAGDGYEVVELKAGTDGKPFWKRVYFSRDPSSAKRDFDRRTGR